MAATMGYGGFLTGPPLIGFLAGVLGFRLAMLVPLLCAVAIAARARQCSIRARVVQFCAQDLGNPPRKTAKRRHLRDPILRMITSFKTRPPSSALRVS
jgi:MFS family permease